VVPFQEILYTAPRGSQGIMETLYKILEGSDVIFFNALAVTEHIAL
jgi:hypothetical protein